MLLGLLVCFVCFGLTSAGAPFGVICGSIRDVICAPICVFGVILAAGPFGVICVFGVMCVAVPFNAICVSICVFV